MEFRDNTRGTPSFDELVKELEAKCFTREEVFEILSQLVDFSDCPTFPSGSLDPENGWENTSDVKIVQETLVDLDRQVRELQKRYEGDPPKNVLDHFNNTISDVRIRLDSLNAIQ